MIQIQDAQGFGNQVIDLLRSEQLPLTDLPGELENFVVAVDDGDVFGVAGLEIYGCYGLFRSLAVKAEKRRKGIADELLNRLEAEGKTKGIIAFYLLTEIAEDYFEKKGYIKIERVAVPDEIKRS